jgi:hypothetical protein
LNVTKDPNYLFCQARFESHLHAFIHLIFTSSVTEGPLSLIAYNKIKAQTGEPQLGAVPHTCNPSYSGGRDQEDQGLKPAWASTLQDLILKNPSPKRAGGVAQGPEFKPQYCKKIKIK